jgi:molybdopterin molybdotransferase
MGMKQPEHRPAMPAKMTRGIATALGRKNFVRVRVYGHNDEMFAEPVSARGSSQISTMTKSNGYVVVSESRQGLAEGELVSVRLFDNVEGQGNCSENC